MRGAVAVVAAAVLLSGCSLPAITAQTVKSQSYRDGYASTREYYSIPKNRDGFLHDDVQNGYSVNSTCYMQRVFYSKDADWAKGCVDAMHDLGLKP